MSEPEKTDRVKLIYELNDDQKKEILDLSKSFTEVYSEMMNGKNMVDVLNLTVNLIAQLSAALTLSISSDQETQDSILKVINTLSLAYAKVARNKDKT